MKIRNTEWIVPVSLAVFLFALPLQAGDLTFFVGGTIPGSIEYQDTEFTPDNGPVYGFRLGTNFVPYFGMEHTLAFSSDYLFPSGMQDILDANGVIYNSNFIFSVPVGKAVPYFTVGAGLIHQYGDSDLPIGTEFAFNYGGGVKFPGLFGPLGLRFDMRGYRAGATSNALHMLEMSGGVMFSFGK